MGDSKGITISNKVLLLDCKAITHNVGIWRLKPHLIQLKAVKSIMDLMESTTDDSESRLFVHHFVVSSATIFVASYLMGLEWSEVLETCFVETRFGDLHQLSPISVFSELSHHREDVGKSVDEVLQRHLFQVIQMSQLLFVEKENGFVSAPDIMQHFANILKLEMD